MKPRPSLRIFLGLAIAVGCAIQARADATEYGYDSSGYSSIAVTMQGYNAYQFVPVGTTISYYVLNQLGPRWCITGGGCEAWTWTSASGNGDNTPPGAISQISVPVWNGYAGMGWSGTFDGYYVLRFNWPGQYALVFGPYLGPSTLDGNFWDYENLFNWPGALYINIYGPQSISFPAIANHLPSDAPFSLGATANSGLPIAYTITSGPGTIIGSKYYITGVGSVTIKASQPGNTWWGAATDVYQSFTISTISTTNYKVNGTDLNAIFQPASYSGVHTGATNHLVNGTDLNLIFEPASSSPSRAALTNYNVNGTDLNQYFCPLNQLGFHGVATFTSSGTWTVPTGVTSVDVLVVAGGGGGGYCYGGGGGGGGCYYQQGYSVTPGATITVTVGGGGYGAWYNSIPGGNGSNSVFGTLTAIGGGGGGSWAGIAPTSGGSGGGGEGNTVVCSGGSGTSGQGYIGGISSWNGVVTGAGGGGGGGGPGGNSITSISAGNGGPGFYCNITGTWVYYAGGGGGGCDPSLTSGTGGTGGGGNAGTASSAAQAVTANSGGGGGGGTNQGGGRVGAAGGSGMIIIKY